MQNRGASMDKSKNELTTLSEIRTWKNVKPFKGRNQRTKKKIARWKIGETVECECGTSKTTNTCSLLRYLMPNTIQKRSNLFKESNKKVIKLINYWPQKRIWYCWHDKEGYTRKWPCNSMSSSLGIRLRKTERFYARVTTYLYIVLNNIIIKKSKFEYVPPKRLLYFMCIIISPLLRVWRFGILKHTKLND